MKSADGSRAIDPAALKREAIEFLQTKPAWMSDWQFKRAQELLNVGGDSESKWLLALSNGDTKPYQAYLDELWRTPTRYWKGWGIEDDLLSTSELKAFVPQHIQDHLTRYWASWLMPDIPTSELFHPPKQRSG